MTVRIEKKGRVWTVIHSRPQARNAMDPESADALVEAFNAFDRDAEAAVAVLWGEGGAFCAGDRLAFDGALPTNTDGGGLSSNHPGMRGIFLVIEATRQLRGEAGPVQVKDAEVALVHGTGGMLGQRHSGATLLLGRG